MATAELTSHLPLLRNLVRREVRQRYKGSVLGLAWTLINPLLVVLAYWVVFKFLFGTPIPNYALFLFVGLMVWSLFFGGLVTASSSLIANANLITKVRFPRLIIPIAAILGNAVIAGAMLVIAVPLCLWLSSESLAPLVLLPAFMLLALVFTLGFGVLVAALNVYFRDVQHIIDALGVPWFFLTPIFYTYSTLPEAAQAHGNVIALLHWGNPVSPFVIVVQDCLFFGQWPPLADSLYCVAAAAIIGLVGYIVFQRLEGEMAVEL